MSEIPDARGPRKFGRPPKPRDEVRSKRVVSFVTRGEFENLVEIADDRGESVSAVVHRILRTELLKQKRGPSG